MKKNKLFAIGGLSIFIDILLFYILMNKFSFHYITSSSVGFLFALIINYYFGSIFFHINKKKNKIFILLLSFLGGFCLNGVLTFIFIRKLLIHYLISKFIQIIILIIYNYFFYNIFLNTDKIFDLSIFTKIKNIIVRICKNINSKFESFISKKIINKIFLFLPHNLVVLILLFISIFTFINFNKYISNDYIYVSGSSIPDGIIDPIVKKTKLDLDFLDTEEDFKYISFRMATYLRTSNLDLTLEIVKNGKTIYSQTENMRKVHDGGDLRYNLDGITLDELKTSDVYLIPGKNLNDNNVVTIFKEKDTDHVFANLVDKQSSNVNIVMIIFSIISAFIYLMINYFINTRKLKIKDYFKYVLAYIVLALFLIPAFQIPDEPVHFYTAYHLSQSNFNNIIVSSDLTVPQNIKCLNYSKIQKSDKVKDIDDIYKCSISAKDENVYDDNTNIKAFLGYVPQTIGIKIADIFSNSPLFIFFFGRLFTCLICFGIVYLAIKITPKYKYLFLAIATMMMFIQQTISYSYDAVMNSCALLFIAYVLKLIHKSEKVSFKDYLILFLLMLIINNIRNYVYLPILIMILFIPIEKFQKKFLKYIFVISIALLSIGITYKINSHANYIINETRTQEYINTAQVKKDNWTSQDQLNYLIANPSNILNIAFKTVEQYGEFYLMSLVGYFGWITFKIDYLYVYIYLLFFLYIILGEKSNFKLKNKLLLIISVIFSISLICLAMYLYWTPYKHPFVEGVQGRYFIPLLLPFFVALIPKKNLYEINDKVVYGCINIFLLQLILTLGSYYY